MNNNDDDYYERQSELLEQFLSKNDKGAFTKMLNMNINSNSDKEKEHKKRPDFMKSMKNKSPARYYDYFHMRQPSYNNNNDLFSNHNHDYKDNQINDFKIDFHNVIQDPEYKDKSMKGNYKWGSMKFNMIKLNLAKRRGVSIDNLHMPKIAERRSSHMEMNGQLVMDNNPLAQSMNNERRIPGGIRNSLKVKMGMIGKLNQESPIKRSLTQKVKNDFIPGNEINKLDINF